MEDIKLKAQRGEGRGLIQDVINRFGRVTGPNGELLYEYDTNRVNVFLWKVVRGLYALELGPQAVLPQQPPAGIELVNPKRTQEALEKIPWFRFVRDTAPMGRYGHVFDFKWIGWTRGRERGHAFAMLFLGRAARGADIS